MNRTKIFNPEKRVKPIKLKLSLEQSKNIFAKAYANLMIEEKEERNKSNFPKGWRNKIIK